ncbi:hypothetical protein BFJ66_g932 [Fusarium oxysporum f. sp. cepae]|uniref:Uncharacterized protein n=1 Tax=Fusarium oxysporum f. sp. cepae TaxID=396571 RepID=A0A3L6NKW7_FUSOX|nr:hypothetical protein BFJ65_g9156 [Fusarium oxysporum f. sp. cepae]RKK34499.1 hypothetical protein BFJ67_g13777 [Fusarium oxysporum f. sp. cepae]RKK62124.1 hypothetical protein BFJ66_g932 [Fusarium oxysporum f. sp. cepae]
MISYALLLSFVFLGAGFGAGFGAGLGERQGFCTEEPALAVGPGTQLAMKLNIKDDTLCTAEIAFSEYLAISWRFQPEHCGGPQLAQFTLPIGIPNGDAYITWGCADESLSCNRIVVSNGKGDLTLPTLITETAHCISPTTLITHVVTADPEKQTGIFLDTRLLNPIIPTAPSSVDSDTTTPVATTPVTPRQPWTTPNSHRSLIGTGGTRKTHETSARLPTGTSAAATSVLTTINTSTNTASITVPVLIPIDDTTTTINTAPVTVPVLIPIDDSTTTTIANPPSSATNAASNTAPVLSIPSDHTTEGSWTNKPSYVTITSIISTCLMPMPTSKNVQG